MIRWGKDISRDDEDMRTRGAMGEGGRDERAVRGSREGWEHVRDENHAGGAALVFGPLLLLVHDQRCVWRHVQGRGEADGCLDLARRGLVRRFVLETLPDVIANPRGMCGWPRMDARGCRFAEWKMTWGRNSERVGIRGQRRGEFRDGDGGGMVERRSKGTERRDGGETGGQAPCVQRGNERKK